MPQNAGVPPESEVIGYMKSLSNWGRWGKDDQMGTLNLITPQKVTQAASLVRQGLTVTCARPVEFASAPDVTTVPPIRYRAVLAADASHDILPVTYPPFAGRFTSSVSLPWVSG